MNLILNLYCHIALGALRIIKKEKSYWRNIAFIPYNLTIRY